MSGLKRGEIFITQHLPRNPSLPKSNFYHNMTLLEMHERLQRGESIEITFELGGEEIMKRFNQFKKTKK